MSKKSFKFQVSGFKLELIRSFEFRVSSFKLWLKPFLRFLNLKPETRNLKPRLWFFNLKPETRNLKLFHAGFTLIELILVLLVVCLLSATAIDRYLYYQERAEKLAMEATLAAIKMGLQIRLAELIITNRQTVAAELERENPIRWLDEPPANYAGEYRVPPKAGNWYFAAGARQLVYVPTNTSYLQWGQAASGELRFQVGLRYNAIETADGKAQALAGIGILPAQAYRWF